MRTYILLVSCPVLLILANVILLTESTKLSKTVESRKQRDEAYNEVINNITRVNNVLNKLVRSYEHLKKMYQTQTDFEGTTEIVLPTKSDVLPTRMVEESIQDSEDVIPDVINNIDRNVPTIEALVDGSAESTSSDTKQLAPTSTEDTLEIKNNRDYNPTNKIYGTTSFSNDSTEDKEKIEKFLMKDVSPQSNVYVVLENKPGQLIPKRQLRNERIKDITKKNPLHNSFPEKKDSIEFKSNNMTMMNISFIDVSLENNKFYTNHSKLQDESGSPSSGSEDDKEIQYVQEKTKILRAEYGEACMKLVVKKCHKACKKSTKAACSAYRCKSGMKSTFIQQAKTCCIAEFGRTPPPQKYKERFRVDNMDGQSDSSPSGFVDVTREGYIAACLPHIYQESQASPANTLSKITPSNAPSAQLNILRDKYERECAKISASKCRRACNSATDKVCGREGCKKRLLKSFRRHCKRNCKAAYRKHHDSRSSGSRSRSSSNSKSSKSDSSSSDRKSSEHSDGSTDSD